VTSADYGAAARQFPAGSSRSRTRAGSMSPTAIATRVRVSP